jgi:hypothetical protein
VQGALDALPFWLRDRRDAGADAAALAKIANASVTAAKLGVSGNYRRFCKDRGGHRNEAERASEPLVPIKGLQSLSLRCRASTVRFPAHFIAGKVQNSPSAGRAILPS